MSSMIPIWAARSSTWSPRPRSTISSPPKPCRSRQARPMYSIWVITTIPVEPSLMRRTAPSVTRFKKNTPLNTAKSMPVEPGTGVSSDRIGFLPGRQAKNRKNPMQGAVREIVVTMQTGGTLRILSNDLDAPAKEIADLYKRHWQIELFFRVIVLPSDEANPENHPFHRPFRERSAHSDRRPIRQSARLADRPDSGKAGPGGARNDNRGQSDCTH
jgi:hypothetical protein